MIDPKHLTIATQLFEAELRHRDKQLAMETAQVKASATASGSFGSRVSMQVTNLCVNELRGRVNLAWDVLQKVLSNLGLRLEGDLAAELQSWVDGSIEEGFEAMSRHLGGTLNSSRLEWSVAPLQEEAMALKREFAARIALLIATLEKRNAAEGGVPSVMNFYGTVGAVQTGAMSTASVSQTISQADLRGVEQAIQRVADEVGAASDLAADAQSDLIDVIRDLRNEFGRERPNTLRVRHLAMAVATTIQTSASLGPAYSALKVALIPLGVVLP